MSIESLVIMTCVGRGGRRVYIRVSCRFLILIDVTNLFTFAADNTATMGKGRINGRVLKNMEVAL